MWGGGELGAKICENCAMICCRVAEIGIHVLYGFLWPHRSNKKHFQPDLGSQKDYRPMTYLMCPTFCVTQILKLSPDEQRKNNANEKNSKKNIKDITRIVRDNNYLINFTDKPACESDIPHCKVKWAILAK